MKLNWPNSLSDITLKNMSMTELWFFKETIDGGGIDMARTPSGYEVRTPKFGYNECYVNIEDQRYLVKHRTDAAESHGGSWNGTRNVVFFVQKHNRKTT